MKQGMMSQVIVEQFVKGDDILERLVETAHHNQLSAGSFVGLGAVGKANVECFKGDGKYSTVSLRGPLEVVSCVGDISLKEGQPFIHANIALADREEHAYGGI